MKVSIIYVNYNTTELLLDSMRSLENLPDDLKYEVIVVDNHSEGFVAEDITSEFPKAKVVVSPENLGFGRGNNLGAAAASGEYLWLLNTDTIVPEENNIVSLISFLDEDTSYAIAAPLLVNDKGDLQQDQIAYFPSPGRIIMNIPVRLAAIVMPGLKSLYSMVNMHYSRLETRDAEVVVSAAAFVRRSVFEQVRGFSPEFFFFFEDSDLCKKVAVAGYKVRLSAEARIIHLHGRSIRGKGALIRRKRLYFASQDVYLRKWHGLTGRIFVRILRLPLIAKYHLAGGE